MSTVYVDVTPSKWRFGGRKQWKLRITGANHEPLDVRDTYSNIGDVFGGLNLLRYSEMHVRVHYSGCVETTVLRGEPL